MPGMKSRQRAMQNNVDKMSDLDGVDPRDNAPPDQRKGHFLKPFTRKLIVFVIAGCNLVFGCQPAHEQKVQPKVEHEQSARPDVNKEYKGKIEVQTWVERFEGESREIYTHREQIVDLVGLRPGMIVADVGAGTGLFTRLFAAKLGTTGRVFAVDITPDFLRHIEETAQAQGLKNITTVLCKDDSVELSPNSIDLAFICDTYHHFEYPRSTMQSLYRALRKNGEIVVIDFDRIEGQTRQWVLDHVRANKDIVRQEITSFGFKEIASPATPFLKENYLMRFRKR